MEVHVEWKDGMALLGHHRRDREREGGQEGEREKRERGEGERDTCHQLDS